MSAKDVNKIIKEVFIYTFLLLVLLITSLNISSYLNPKQVKVLGTETENKEEVFWQDFLSKNPNYIPGWVEVGRMDVVQQIDPNYEVR